MSESRSSCCNNIFLASNVQSFLAKPNTLASQNCHNYWTAMNGTQKRKVDICLEEFSGACKIQAIKDDAYNFFTTAEDDQEPLACQNIFPNWSGNKSPVDFWMKDNGAAD